MSERYLINFDESEEDNLYKKALPWSTTALDRANYECQSKKEAISCDSSTSSLPIQNINNISIKNKTRSKPSSSLDSEKLLTKSIARNSPRYSRTIESNKTSPDNRALLWKHDIEDVEMKGASTEINILLLGESGVGKSTFINSFANYMKHENFEAVQQNNLSVLIPARFHIFDKEFKKHLIEIGANDQNEYLADGAAATQDVKTYVFYITLDSKSYLIRLIDTPGIGDPRGIAQDNKNCDYVLNYLSRLEKIHAICLLLKPTNTRLDVFLNYCVTQILSRLEKSATDNIAFLFTNTRGQNYTPGDTYTSLELLVKKIKDTNNVTLPLSHKNVFCFDNEAFRFLASVKQGVEFKEGILEANIESWKYSNKEVYRLLSDIVHLKPHDPKKTISINHARRMVLQLSQPLAEIVQLIGDNIYQLDQHTNQLCMENQTLGELKQKLHMPVIDIKVKQLSQPVTVCTAPQCSTIYKVADKNKFHYKQRCHNPCYLNNVPAEIVGDPHLLECWAITTSTQTCHECGCRFNTHMHIYYETDTFENKIVDQNVLENIKTKEDATREKQTLINKILDYKGQLEREHKQIIKYSAEFAHFLQHNAITPVNDSLREYVKYLITREENLGPSANRATLDYLRRLLAEYEQEKSVLEEALKRTKASAVSTLSPSTIELKIQRLFSLKNFGKKIKHLYDLHQTGGLREHKQSEFVVKERYTLGIINKVKSWIPGLGNSKKQSNLEIEQKRPLENQKSLQQHYPYNQLQRYEFDLQMEARGWASTKDCLSNSERAYQRNQYALEYGDPDVDVNLRRQYLTNNFDNFKTDKDYQAITKYRTEQSKGIPDFLDNSRRQRPEIKLDPQKTCKEIVISKDRKNHDIERNLVETTKALGQLENSNNSLKFQVARNLKSDITKNKIAKPAVLELNKYADESDKIKNPVQNSKAGKKDNGRRQQPQNKSSAPEECMEIAIFKD